VAPKNARFPPSPLCTTGAVTVGFWAIMFRRVATISGIVAHATDRRTTHRSRKLQDIVDQHLPEIAEGIGVTLQTLKYTADA
jgi:hypothetical protein